MERNTTDHDAADETETELPTVTEEEYWAMVDTAAEMLAEEFEEEAREYVRTGEAPDDVEVRIQEEAASIVQFSLDHPHRLGFRYGANYAYLGSLLEHSDHTGNTGYFDFVREGERGDDGPVNAAEALAWGALFAMVKDVRDAASERFDAIKDDEREAQEGDQ